MSNQGFTSRQALVIIILALALVGLVFLVPSLQFAEMVRMDKMRKAMDQTIAAQNRLVMRRGSYSLAWSALDNAPMSNKIKKNGHLSLDGSTIFTGGGGETNPNPGFAVKLEAINNQYFISARRIHRLYGYTLVRPFKEQKIYCIPSEDKPADAKICMEMMNVSSPEQLPQDPRPKLHGFFYY